MKRKGYLLLLALLLLLLTACLASCKDDKTDQDTTPPIFTVTFDSQGGTAVSAQHVASGNTVTEPEIPARDGYVFDHWKNRDTQKQWNFISGTVDGNITLQAVWIEAKYFYTVEPIGNSELGVLTGLKEREMREYRIPTVVNGFTVTRIGTDAFADLSSEHVERIILPETVTEIGDGALKNCKDIQIIVSGELRLVGEQAFKNCNLLQEVYLAEGMTEIGAEAFWGCSSLREIRLPASLLTLGENAFQDCSSLIGVQMYDGVTRITNGAFYGCHSLQVLYLRGDEEKLHALLETAATMNEPFVNCEKRYLYSESEPTNAEPTEFDGFWYLDTNGAFRLWSAQ